MKHLRSLCALFVCALLSVSLTSCSDDGPKPKKTEDQTENFIDENAPAFKESLKDLAWVGVSSYKFNYKTHTGIEFVDDNTYRVAIIFKSGQDFIAYVHENDYHPIYGKYTYMKAGDKDNPNPDFDYLAITFNGKDKSSNISGSIAIAREYDNVNWIWVYDNNPDFADIFVDDIYKLVSPDVIPSYISDWQAYYAIHKD